MHGLVRLQINVAIDDIRIEACAQPARAQPHGRGFQHQRFAHEAFNLHRRAALGDNHSIHIRALDLALEAGAFKHTDFHALPAELAAGLAQFIELRLIRRGRILTNRAARIERVDPIFLNIQFKHL